MASLFVFSCWLTFSFQRFKSLLNNYVYFNILFYFLFEFIKNFKFNFNFKNLFFSFFLGTFVLGLEKYSTSTDDEGGYFYLIENIINGILEIQIFYIEFTFIPIFFNIKFNFYYFYRL